MQNSSLDHAFAVALRHHQGGKLSEAEQAYRQILQQNPDHSDALHFLGVIAFQTGNLEPALELIEQSVVLRPDGAVYRNNLGQVLERQGRNDEAASAYAAAIRLDSNYAEAFNNLGHVYAKQDQPEKAEAHYRTAIRLNPDYSDPHTNLGNLLKDRGELDAALGEYRRAISLSPGQSYLHSNLLLTLHYHPDYGPTDLQREHEAWAKRHVAPLVSSRRPHHNDPDPNRPLRIGYVSPDFREHAITRFILPLLAGHNRQDFEIYAYSDVVRPDAVSDSIQALVQQWRDINAMSDAQVVDTIRNDQIDILVDLAAHSGRNRLLVFARKPAPVQVTYLAYCSTTGVDAIDYRLTDRFLDPPGTDLSCYTERTVHLPGSYWCYSAPDLSADNMPASERLAGPPTFGCLNNFAKVSNPTLTVWMELLRRVPEAQLLLYAPPGTHRERVRSAMQKTQLAENRVSFVSRQSFADYLQSYRQIDVALDPFPYGGGTTTCDALWMGVPVISLAGRTAVSRAGASLLSNVGLEQFVTQNEQHYLEQAADLIRNSETLGQLRRELRHRLETSPVMNSAQFAHGLEAELRQMWRTWCESNHTATRS